MIAFENRLVVFILFILAAISALEFYNLQTESNKGKSYGHYPDSIGENLILHRYDETGFLAEVATAKSATHFPDTKTTLFQDIHLQVFNHQGNPPWLISAPSGIAYGNGDKLEALGAVHMEQAAYQTHPASQIDTQDVTIFTDQKYMITQAPVLATQPGMIVHGIGAKYDYDKDILNLFNQVQVNYQPKENPQH